MQTLLNMFDEEEKDALDTSEDNLRDLKDIYNQRVERKNYKEFRFHIKTIFSFIQATSPKNVDIQPGKREDKIEKMEFNPTISPPDILAADSKAKPYSIWYKPVIFVPSKNSAKKLVPEFLIMKGERESIYDIDSDFKKSLYTYEFLSGSSLKHSSEELLDKMNKAHVVMHIRRKYRYRDIYSIKDSDHYLNPNNLVVVSEKEFPPEMKMNIPLKANLQEKTDFSKRKLQDKAMSLLE